MRLRENQQAFMLPTIIITSLFLISIGILISQLAVNNFNIAISDVRRASAQFAVDAGLDYSIVELNNDNDWTGTSGEIQLIDDGTYRTTFESTVTNGSSSQEKTITVTGRTYFPSSDTSPESERTFAVDVSGQGPLDLGTFSIVTGVGGLYMENSSKILAGDVYVNGEITMENTAQIGTASSPGVVRAAHSNCPNPADSTYPRVCASGENGEPISITNSAHIYGEVQATNQTDGSGMSDPGLVAGSPPVQPLPTHDRDAQKTAATNTMTAAAASCSSNNGTRTIPANTYINGDVSWRRNCDITILGDVWISGNVEMRQSAEVIVADSLGTTMPTIMIDGEDGLTMENSSSLTANSDSTGVRIVTYYSAASCSPNCADVTGTDLEATRDHPTITLEQSAQAPESIYFARWSQVNIVNSGDIGALIGQTVRLRNSTTVTFGTSVSGGGGPSAALTFTIDSYRQVIN